MKKDIEILSQTFERVIDRKEAIIKSLVKDIEEAEEQYQMALRSNVQSVDQLIGKYSSMMSEHMHDHLGARYLLSQCHSEMSFEFHNACSSKGLAHRIQYLDYHRYCMWVLIPHHSYFIFSKSKTYHEDNQNKNDCPG